MHNVKKRYPNFWTKFSNLAIVLSDRYINKPGQTINERVGTFVGHNANNLPLDP